MHSLKALLYIAVFYAVPLAAQPALIVDPRVLTLMVFCAIIVLSQPEMTVSDAQKQRNTDGLSVLAILVAAAVAQIGAVLEWAYWRDAPRATASWVVAGAACLVIGTALRLWAIATLGRFFTATVQCQDGQEVISDGPFRWVRHPSYLGAYLGVVGSAVLLQAPVSAAIGSVSLGLAYAYRIHVEEKTLVCELEGYRDYQARTARIVPVVW